MSVVVTGAAGFLGSRLTELLLSADSPLQYSRLVLVDAVAPPPRDDPRVLCRALDLAAPDAAGQLVDGSTLAVFHLAAVVSGAAERDFDLGLRVNLDATRHLLEALRRSAPRARLVFVSTCAVYGGGGGGGGPVDERTSVQPESSYGAAKAMSELLVAEYHRRGLAAGCALRLPTVTVRPGAPNAAVTSFASGVLREPLAGLEAECPVPADTALWVASPATVVRNILHAALVPAEAWGARPVVNLPGLTVTVRDMLAALRAAAGDAAVERVRFRHDDTIARIVTSLPIHFDTSRALSLGFVTDTSFDDILRHYITHDMPKS